MSVKSQKAKEFIEKQKIMKKLPDYSTHLLGRDCGTKVYIVTAYEAKKAVEFAEQEMFEMAVEAFCCVACRRDVSEICRKDSIYCVKLNDFINQLNS